MTSENTTAMAPRPRSTPELENVLRIVDLLNGYERDSNRAYGCRVSAIAVEHSRRIDAKSRSTANATIGPLLSVKRPTMAIDATTPTTVAASRKAAFSSPWPRVRTAKQP